MSNIVTVIPDVTETITFASLPVGTIFRRAGTTSEPNVYMKFTNAAQQSVVISLDTGIVRSIANWAAVEVLSSICIKSE